MVIEHAEKSVCRDELLRTAIFPDNIRLYADIVYDRFGNETLFLQHHVRIVGVCECVARKVNLLPVRVGLVPECRAHGAVQVFERAVFLFKVFSERLVVARRVVAVCFAVDFIVNLPADDRRVCAVMRRNVLNDLLYKIEIHGGCHVVVLAHTVVDRVAVNITV